MNMENLDITFLRTTFFDRIASVEADRKPLWGKMNVQQMIEHLSDSVRIANGITPHSEIRTPAERLPAVREFLFSEKEFRPETRNALMGDEPPALRLNSLDEALQELRAEVERFIRHFADQPGRTERNPFFGDLDEAGWAKLFHKHFLHHLKQFHAA